MPQSSNARDIEPLWEPAIIVPAQFVRRRGGPRSPEAWLMAAVLEDAFLCVSRNVGARDCRRRRELNEACDWFWSESQDWPFAFVPLCNVLGLEVAAVRHRVWKLVAAHHATAKAQPAAPWPLERTTAVVSGANPRPSERH